MFYKWLVLVCGCHNDICYNPKPVICKKWVRPFLLDWRYVLSHLKQSIVGSVGYHLLSYCIHLNMETLACRSKQRNYAICHKSSSNKVMIFGNGTHPTNNKNKTVGSRSEWYCLLLSLSQQHVLAGPTPLVLFADVFETRIVN